MRVLFYLNSVCLYPAPDRSLGRLLKKKDAIHNYSFDVLVYIVIYYYFLVFYKSKV